MTVQMQEDKWYAVCKIINIAELEKLLVFISKYILLIYKHLYFKITIPTFLATTNLAC